MDKEFGEKFQNAVAKARFNRMTGIEPLAIDDGYGKVRMVVREEHLNIHGICHGAITFAVMDEAFQLASNSHGTSALALTLSINYVKPVKLGDELIGEAFEANKTRRTGSYRFEVKNQHGEIVAIGQGVVFRKDEPMKLPENG